MGLYEPEHRNTEVNPTKLKQEKTASQQPLTGKGGPFSPPPGRRGWVLTSLPQVPFPLPCAPPHANLPEASAGTLAKSWELSITGTTPQVRTDLWWIYLQEKKVKEHCGCGTVWLTPETRTGQRQSLASCSEGWPGRHSPCMSLHPLCTRHCLSGAAGPGRWHQTHQEELSPYANNNRERSKRLSCNGQCFRQNVLLFNFLIKNTKSLKHI